MRAVWIAVPVVLLVGAPFVAAALARAVREVTATRRSITTLSRDLRAAGDGLADASSALASSFRAFRDDLDR